MSKEAKGLDSDVSRRTQRAANEIWTTELRLGDLRVEIAVEMHTPLTHT